MIRPKHGTRPRNAADDKEEIILCKASMAVKNSSSYENRKKICRALYGVKRQDTLSCASGAAYYWILATGSELTRVHLFLVWRILGSFTAVGSYICNQQINPSTALRSVRDC